MANEIHDSYQTQLRDSISELLYCCPTLAQLQLSEETKIMKLKKGELLIRKGDTCMGVYIVLDGMVKIFDQVDDAKKILSFKGTNDVIGLEYVLENRPYSFNVSCISELTVAFIPLDKLKKFMGTHPNSFFSFMRMINKKATNMENHSVLMLTGDAEKIVLKTIVDLKKKFGTDANGYLKIRISVKDLASYLGLSKTSLYRVLQSLQQKSYLSHYLNRYRLEKSIS